jgi:hypothetical protein
VLYANARQVTVAKAPDAAFTHAEAPDAASTHVEALE